MIRVEFAEPVVNEMAEDKPPHFDDTADKTVEAVCFFLVTIGPSPVGFRYIAIVVETVSRY
jgi:hypothetical protein